MRLRLTLYSIAANCMDFDRAVKMNLANEGLEARKKEEEVAAKKRKAEDDATWEGVSLLSSVVLCRR